MTHILSFRRASCPIYALVAESEDFMRNVNLFRIENSCREILTIAYNLMIDCKWSAFEAYSYANDLLLGMTYATWNHTELSIIFYYKEVARNKMYK